MISTMLNTHYKNDYKIYSDIQNFANQTLIGKTLKPLFKDLYKRIKPYLPYPRDFILKSIHKKGVCLEVGVYDGIFSEHIFRIAKPKRLFLVDPWMSEYHTGSKFDPQIEHEHRYQNVLNLFAKPIKEGRVKVIRDTSDNALLQLNNERFDFIYIDGDHGYEQVKRDLEHYFPLLSLRGIFAGDDYHYASVKQAVDEFAHERGLLVHVKENQFIFKTYDKNALK